VTGFDRIVMVDWSGGNDTGAKPRQDAIWLCVAGEEPEYLRNRNAAEARMAELIEAALADEARLMIGFDFPFGYPAGFARALTGSDDPFALWDWLAERIEDAPKTNNRFDIAGAINLALGGGPGPFWGNGLGRDIEGLPRTKAGYENPFADRRACERDTPGAFTLWQLAGAGSVGSQALMGLPVLARLRHRFEGKIAVWPFEPLDRPIAFVEIWPSLLARIVNAEIAARTARGEDAIKDAVQVELIAQAVAALSPDAFARMAAIDAPEEGWIFGLGHEEELARAARTLRPPPLRNDCFALPAGVDWTPVDTALALLKERLHPVTGTTKSGLFEAEGRILAEDVIARRANPPHPNTAVDGYGFAAASVGEGDAVLPLVQGRAAAGAPFEGPVPRGSALRVLTGADLPEGVDTVVLDEDCSVGDGRVAFRGGVKPGANTRKAGEDAGEGDRVLSAGRKLTAPDLALAAAVGHGTLPIREKLRVAVLSTGDELTEPGDVPGAGGIFDANRPMLLSTLARWGHVPVDLGRIPDDRSAVAAAFDRAGRDADVLLTSGGASAGDEDHVSALLREAGAMQEWRIALKPGRPLALGLWNDIPVFGLPGNPVAAFVCTLIFARPALTVLAGGNWAEPQGFEIPAAFEKRKKPGRREYLRARMRDGRAEVFPSEGSGRVSSLSWGEGLVEIEDGERHIRPGDPVRFIPYGSFGL
jgi:molybdopterin molybdotransferase